MPTAPNTPPADQTQSGPDTTTTRKIKTKQQVIGLEAQIAGLTAQLEAAKNENENLKARVAKQNEDIRGWKEAYEGKVAELRNAEALLRESPAERDVLKKKTSVAVVEKERPTASSGLLIAIAIGVASLLFGVVLTILHFRQEDSLKAHQEWMFSTQDDLRDLQKEVRELKKP